MFNVTNSEPNCSPITLFDKPGPCPNPTGTLPLKSGSAKVVVPFPP